MPVQMRSVYSQTIAKIGHDPETKELIVDWKSGKRSVYSGVDTAKANDVMNAESIGKAVHALVKGQHSHRYEG